MDIFDKKCQVCERELTDISNTYKINNNQNMAVCDICKNHIENLKNKNIIAKEDVSKSLTYLYPYSKTCKNTIVGDYLKAIIDSANSMFIKKATIPKKTSSGWISGMRIIAWIMFLIITMGGILLSLSPITGREPIIAFIILIGSLIFAFLAVAFIMIFLDMAEDIKAIRNNTQNK